MPPRNSLGGEPAAGRRLAFSDALVPGFCPPPVARGLPSRMTPSRSSTARNRGRSVSARDCRPTLPRNVPPDHPEAAHKWAPGPGRSHPSRRRPHDPHRDLRARRTALHRRPDRPSGSKQLARIADRSRPHDRPLRPPPAPQTLPAAPRSRPGPSDGASTLPRPRRRGRATWKTDPCARSIGLERSRLRSPRARRPAQIPIARRRHPAGQTSGFLRHPPPGVRPTAAPGGRPENLGASAALGFGPESGPQQRQRGVEREAALSSFPTCALLGKVSSGLSSTRQTILRSSK